MREWLNHQPPTVFSESLRLFSLCQAMEWGHLPEPGGLYQQHPKLLEEWFYIWEQKSAHEKREHEERERKMKQKNSSNRSGRRRR